MSATRAITRLLIANRGEIAVRIARTAKRMGIETVAIFSDADAGAPHVRACDLAVRVGATPPGASYANADAVLAAAVATRADAVHPGYGFLAENAEFAQRCIDAGLVFVGPSPATMRALGDKSSAKRLLAGSAVPLLPGYDGVDQRDETLEAAATALGMPIMIKAAAGGGGRGMRLVENAGAFRAALASARSEALASFGSADVLLERALVAPRHIEVQIFGDAFGSVVHLGERDCSVQRRHQKLLEESPSPAVDAALRARIVAAALAAARLASYENAGTVEFLLDERGEFSFIEVNARLQVEHPVTEAVTGLDLVEWQLRVARGEPLPLTQAEIHFSGHAIEARLCAEDPAHDFLPQAGTLVRWEPPAAVVRVDHALESGTEVSPAYDSMIAKLIAAGPTRDDARRALVSALEATVAFGLPTNRDALIRILENADFARGSATTALLETLSEEPARAGEADLALAAALRYRCTTLDGTFGEFSGWSSTQHPGATMRLAPRGDRDSTNLHVRGTPHLVRTRAAEALNEIAFTGDAGGTSGTLRASIDGAPWQEVTFLARAEEIEYLTRGRTLAFVDLRHETAGGAGGPALDGILRAPMSGRIARIDAVPGETCAAGSPLVVIEAMKMEHHLTLPAAVAIAVVEASIGAQVSLDDILLRYEVAPAAP